MAEISSVPILHLGSQGFEVSAQGLGCMGMSMAYGPPKPEEEMIALIRHDISKGITFLDTSDVYGPFTNEVLVGKAIKGIREKVQLATKFGVSFVDGKPQIHGDPAYVRAACEASLKRLDVDYIDLYYQHRIDTKVPIEVTIGEMKKLVEEGRIKYIGLSEASASTIRRAHAVHPITAVQLEWSLWTRDAEDEIIPTCRELGIGIVPYCPLGQGFLSSGAKLLENLADNDLRKTDHGSTGTTSRQDDRRKGPAEEHTPSHGTPDDSLYEEELSSSPCPLLLLRKNAQKATLEFEHLVDASPQTPKIVMRITQLMTQLETYKRYLTPAAPGVSGSGTQGQEIAEPPSRTPSTPLGGSREMHPAQEDTQPAAERVGSDEADMANYIIAFPGAKNVSSTRTINGMLLVKNEGVPIKHVQLLGNNEFYRFLESHALVIFGPTIRTRWNSHNSNLKKELLDYLESLFGVGTFDRTTVARVASKYLKYTRDTYRKQLQFNPRYNRPLTVPESEWRALIHDGKEKREKKEGKMPTGPARLPDTLKTTKSRIEKKGHHKLGQGGYLKLTAKIGDEFGTETTEEDKNTAFCSGYEAVVEYRRSLGQVPRSRMPDKGSNTFNEPNDPVVEQCIESEILPEEHVPNVQPNHCSGDQADNATISEDHNDN